MSQGFEVAKAERSIEEDFKVLRDIDERISDLLQQRYERVDIINAQQEANAMKIRHHEDFLEGTVRGNPIPARDTPGSVDYESQGIENVRPFGSRH